MKQTSLLHTRLEVQHDVSKVYQVVGNTFYKSFKEKSNVGKVYWSLSSRISLKLYFQNRMPDRSSLMYFRYFLEIHSWQTITSWSQGFIAFALTTLFYAFEIHKARTIFLLTVDGELSLSTLRLIRLIFSQKCKTNRTHTS